MRTKSMARRFRALALLAISLQTGCHDASKPAGPAVAKAAAPKALKAQAVTASTPEWRVGPTPAALGLDDPGLQLVVSASTATPVSQDRTHQARWSVNPPGTVSVDAGGYVQPLKAGKATVTAALPDTSISTEISVESEPERPWSFKTDIVPVLTRLGCNTGGCHGRADGQGGFRLSLFGYDPDSDFNTITREAGGRRVDRLRPEQSLIVRKATGRVSHGGGRRLDPGSPAYQAVLGWLAAGAPVERGKTHGDLVGLTVEPPTAVLDAPGPLQLRVIARFKDGHARDVTRLADLRSNDDRVATVDGKGAVRLLRGGETDLIARYGTRVVAARVAAPVNPKLDFDFSEPKHANFIDEHVYKRLAALKVPPSATASDSTFLRRLSFDLTGQLPEPDEVKAFVADSAPDKRARKVDELMARADFQHFWRIKLGDLLQVTRAKFGNGAGAYETWMIQVLKENRRWDRVVRELLTTLGDPTDRLGGGPVNYALDGPDPQTQAEQTARRFLGIRMRCAQCHNHPFDVWTQDDYYGLAAFFAKIDRGGGGDPAMMAMRYRVGINPKGFVNHKRTGQPAAPRLPDGTPVQVGDSDDPRVALADWMTQPENPYFARATANWVWAQFFGRGLVEPVDDMSSANPPVHPKLLNDLARMFVENKYDLRWLIRTVATSEIYGLASSTVPGNEHDTRLFSHQMARPLTAHQMADALAQATQVPNLFTASARNRMKAIEVFDPGTPSVILDTFGRCPRAEACSPVGSPQVSLRQALLLIGGDVVDGKVSHLNGYLSSLLELSPSPGEVVEFLYMRTLCRPPTEEERSHWEAELAGSPSLREAAEDLFWALLNSREFAFNH